MVVVNLRSSLDVITLIRVDVPRLLLLPARWHPSGTRSQLFNLGHGSCRRFAQLLDLKVMTHTSAPASESAVTALELLPVNGFVVGHRKDFVL